jgi:hypothetical protein
MGGNGRSDAVTLVRLIGRREKTRLAVCVEPSI